MNKQIEEMARVLDECCNEYDEHGNHVRNKCASCEYWSDTNNICVSYNMKEAEALYNAGYRKQIVGEWIYQEYSMGHYVGKCSLCECEADMTKFCPNCGAKMKGDEGK